jgi:adenosylmethionine-8-amino-7-oxononanoate aminotransferase
MKTFFHGHSYTANPISCAAACASIDLLSTYQDRIHALCKLQNDFLLSLSNNPIVKNIRRTGTIVAFEVNSEYENYFDNIKQKLYIKFLNEGVLLRPLGNTVYIMPPYCIQKEELEKIYSVIEKVLNEIN